MESFTSSIEIQQETSEQDQIYTLETELIDHVVTLNDMDKAIKGAAREVTEADARYREAQLARIVFMEQLREQGQSSMGHDVEKRISDINEAFQSAQIAVRVAHENYHSAIVGRETFRQIERGGEGWLLGNQPPMSAE